MRPRNDFAVDNGKVKVNCECAINTTLTSTCIYKCIFIRDGSARRHAFGQVISRIESDSNIEGGAVLNQMMRGMNTVTIDKAAFCLKLH